MMGRIESSSKTVSARQVGLMAALAMVATKVVMLPSIISAEAGRDAWISFLISVIVSMFLIFLTTYVIKNSREKSFYEILKKMFSTVGAKIVCVLILCFFIFKILLTDYEMQGFLFEVLYEYMNWNIFIIPVFLVIGFMAFKGPRVMGRVTEIMFIFALLVFALAIFGGIGNFVPKNLLPIGEKGIGAILEGALSGFSIGGNYIFFFIILENISEKTKIYKNVLTCSAIALALVVIFYIVFVAIFGEIGMFIRDGITKMTQFSPVVRQNSRLDGLVVIGWLPIVLVQVSIYLFASGWCVKHIFGIKSFAWCITLVLFTFFGIKLIPTLSVNAMLETLGNYFAIISITLQVGLPVTLSIYTLVRLKKDNKEGNPSYKNDKINFKIKIKNKTISANNNPKLKLKNEKSIIDVAENKNQELAFENKELKTIKNKKATTHKKEKQEEEIINEKKQAITE